MNAIERIFDKKQRTVWLRAFRIWQHRPHEVAPLSDTTHTCSSCGTSFTGNYCPRCGQSAKVGRFSFVKAFLLFLDVWGVGNRGMFRSIRDLMLRPGYMIRDYLSGMQSAYFPPFKMFFLLTAFSFVVEHGFSLGLDEESDKKPETEAASVEQALQDVTQEINKNTSAVASEIGMDSAAVALEIGKDSSVIASETGKDSTAVQKSGSRHVTLNGKEIDSPMYLAGVKFAKILNKLREKNPSIFAFITLVLFTVPLFFFLRSAPAIGKLRYSEFIVALVYTANTYSLYSIAGNLLNSSLLKLIAVLMVFVSFKQFSGYSKRRLLGYFALTILISSAVIAAVMGIGIYQIYLDTLHQS